MKNIALLFSLLISAFTVFSQNPSVIPQPVSISFGTPSNAFNLDKGSLIYTNDTSSNKAVRFLQAHLNRYYQINLTQLEIPDAKRKNRINLIINKSNPNNKNQYTLLVAKQNITITSATDTGIFYGIQTLIQLLPTNKTLPLAIAATTITDYPRFDYRGMHLDVSRHFFDVAFVKRYIDYLAYHKMNYFHWHLTDDHGWRIEIKKYPKLTDIGAWRKGSIVGLYPGKGNEHIKYQVLPKDVVITPKNAKVKTDGIRYGGYYTQQEVKEVIQYAAARYITIIPEIEMPAHSMAALAAYPTLGTEPNKKYEVAETWGMMNKYNNVFQPTDQTFNFLQDVLAEVMDLFPSQYIHIGGDEASKIWWRKSAENQALMKKYGVKDEVALQSYFIQRIEKFVNSKGKTIIGWDEILDGGLAPNAIVMSWRGEKGGIAAAKAQHKVIMTPEEKLYLNHSQFVKDDSLTAAKYLPLRTVYDYDPVPASLSPNESQYIWGAQGNLWSEYIANPTKVDYMIFPRMDALSEILWSPKDQRNYTDFLNRLKTQFKRYDLMGISYSPKYLSINP